MTLDILTNILIFALTGMATLSCFRTEEGWKLQSGMQALRYFTILSNLLCAAASLLFVLTLTQQDPAYWAWVLKYTGTAAVTVTLLTVLFFLGPTIGYRLLLTGRDFYLHLCGPLLALISFCFLEREYELGFPLFLVGMLPVLLYGLVYFYEVIIRRRWEDFYGYNKNGRWPISMAAMFVGCFLVCVLIRAVYNLCE